MKDFTETIEYFDKIDQTYLDCKAKNLSRYSDEWSEFSRPMNIEIRKKIESNHPEKLLLKMVLPYWFNRSIMLELYFTKKHKIRRNRLRKLSENCTAIRKDVSRGRANEDDMLTLNDIARLSLKGAL
uniref:Uncharacterized protein n=1 Tax=viral metagenome TaxID=1070528 RepID=A0A6M3JWK8_9ZZZZ